MLIKHAVFLTDADPAHVRALLALGPEDWGDVGFGSDNSGVVKLVDNAVA
jgi:hypothetical protein